MEKENKTIADPLPTKTCPRCGEYYRGSLEWAHPKCRRIFNEKRK